MTLSYQELEHMVDDVYKFRETYYKNHPNAPANVKQLHIDEKVAKVMDEITESLNACKDTSSADQFLFLKGKLLNLSPTSCAEAESILTRYVKLHPRHVDAWNILGECFWKKSDMTNAKNCFQKSIDLGTNSVALRCLSMLYRKLPGTKEEVHNFMKESLVIARNAVAHDINDGKNWYVLGNVYIGMYFRVNQNQDWLKQAVKAYSNASRHENVKNDSDFHFNRGVAHSYLEDFGMALKSYDMASECDPNWEEPKVYKGNLETFINNCQSSIATKGNTKSRKIKDLVKALKSNHIGPYENPYTKIQDGNSISVQLSKCCLNDLAIGENLNKCVLGKVICHIYSPNPVTFTFCIIDDENAPCRAVNVYNIAEGKGVKIGDSVAIPEPFVSKVEFQYQDKEFQFNWIKVDDPLCLVVNGKLLSTDNRAYPILQTVFNPES